MTPFQLEWWAYLCMVISFFVTCLGLNYIVKKINEAKIDERFIRMLQKASTTQSTQVNGPLIPLETSGDRLNSSKTPQRSPLGISLVFNREQNRRKTILKRLDAFSLSNMSQDKINVIPVPSKRNANDTVSIKAIESKNIDAKHTSSQKFSETNDNDAGVTDVISFKRNEVQPVQEIVALPVNIKGCSKSELVSEREGPPLLHIDNNVSQDVIIKANVVIKKVEETTFNEIDCVKEHVPIKSIYSSLLITKPSFLEIAMKRSKGSYDIQISNEEIDPGIFITTSLDNLASPSEKTLKNKSEDSPNITSASTKTLKNNNEDPPRVKSATDTRRTEPNDSPNKEEGERNVIDFIPIKKNKSASVGKLVPKSSIPISLKLVEDMRSENLIKKMEDTIKTTNDNSGNDQVLTVKPEEILILPVPNEERDIVINKPSSSTTNK